MIASEVQECGDQREAKGRQDQHQQKLAMHGSLEDVKTQKLIARERQRGDAGKEMK